MGSVTHLLAKARRAGCTVEAAGDRLVIRGPRSAGPIVRQLLDRKPVVLAALFVERVREAVGGQIVANPVTIARPLPAFTSDDDTHEDDGAIMPGWTRRAWRDRLRQLSALCRELNPARSAELMAMADDLG